MKFVKLDTNDSLNQLIHRVYWDGAFLKDSLLRSPYTDSMPTDKHATRTPPNALLLILTPQDRQFSGIEWAFFEVETFRPPLKEPVHPVGWMSLTYWQQITLSLTGDLNFVHITAKQSAYRLLTWRTDETRTLRLYSDPFAAAADALR
jgi:hypothetical protein